MVLATYNNNSVSYPIDVYKKYNKYLIKEYEKFYLWFDNDFIGNKETCMQLILTEIKDLNYLLSENTVNVGNDIVKLFNIMTWEDSLVRSYKLLNSTLIYNNMKGLTSLKVFMRREKIKRINDNVRENRL